MEMGDFEDEAEKCGAVLASLSATVTVDDDAFERAVAEAESVAWNGDHGRQLVASRADEYLAVDIRGPL